MPVSYAGERSNKKQVTALKASWSRVPEQLRARQHHALSMRKGNLKAHKCSKWMQVMSGETEHDCELENSHCGAEEREHGPRLQELCATVTLQPATSFGTPKKLLPFSFIQ